MSCLFSDSQLVAILTVLVTLLLAVMTAMAAAFVVLQEVDEAEAEELALLPVALLWV